MSATLFKEEDILQIRERGMTPDGVASQMELLRKGFPHARLKRPCTAGDGIRVLDESDLAGLDRVFSRALSSGRVMKFVPASGAATRMFKSLISFRNRFGERHEGALFPQSDKDDPDCRAFTAFADGIRMFAFYEDLKSSASRDGLDPEILFSKGRYGHLLDYTLTSKGLDLAGLPKGLIKFHRYPDHARTPVEEHLVEAAAYARDANGVARIHFTVSPEHEEPIIRHIKGALSPCKRTVTEYEWGVSTQRASTDTIAADMENRPFRDRAGRLVFRPGGHGALLVNLDELEGDIIFIKNIDNVVPDRLKKKTHLYKKALGGYLVDLQNRIFEYLERLTGRGVSERDLEEIFHFAADRLSIPPPRDLEGRSREGKIDFLVTKLNRPLRVCGMVRNVGEPGGGPFWVEHADGTLSLQIVESSQVDTSSPEQRAVWKSSTHFNPVDLVCGVRDYLGRPFDLKRFTDPETGFISIKSAGGRELKALELPGLWNGSMAYWNTVFVEVPIVTFNPVKTVLDLLRPEHQPE
jgi:hypothetical protein